MAEEPIVSISDLHMSYTEGESDVLKGINFDIYPGEIIGYIGPNGAGKSTTVKVMLGMIEDYRGKVEIFNQNVANKGVDYKKRIGYLPESGEIYENLTGHEYLTFLGEMYGMELEEVTEKAKKLMALFGIKDSYQVRISSYSKGMKQKLLIIASLIHDPDLLFLDEPLRGLDANSAMIFKEILAQLAEEGKTIFYSSHIMEVVERISNRILLLKEGEIIADGSFKELKQKSKEGSLEKIFNQLTGFDEHEGLASDFVDTIKGEK